MTKDGLRQGMQVIITNGRYKGEAGGVTRIAKGAFSFLAYIRLPDGRLICEMCDNMEPAESGERKEDGV